VRYAYNSFNMAADGRRRLLRFSLFHKGSIA
jgi:hypothetical protein